MGKVGGIVADGPVGEVSRPESPPDADDVVLTATLIAIAVVGIVCAVAATIMWQGPTMAAVPVTAAGTVLLALLTIGHVLNK